MTLNAVLKSQELYTEENQNSEIQGMGKGNYFGYAAWITEFLQALKLDVNAFVEVVYSFCYLLYKGMIWACPQNS